ncbi:CopG family transcriptional regulator [Arsukibacterium ikkense]|uniref:CopG family transcriptional regulator n=1 Tax=Arsukibacterium ikkense TaxID=336831 RepID=A0A0M2VAP6_9GAMM|nr:YlcI/YnfO family protein [Arsukibacterium ikkense]KKO46208.1 CopG family transcriptional regulator [Arsukibacterium ikkense]
MSTLSLRLPDSLHQQVKALAKKDGVSINQFVSSAVAEKMTALLTEEYLLARQQQGSEQAFLQAMDKVAEAEPAKYDREK